MNIIIADRQRTKQINGHRLKEIVHKLFGELNIQEAELGIHLVGAREMAQVNKTFLQHEGPTDVITFNHTEKNKAESRKRKPIHGELFICVAVAVTQAKEFNCSWQAEVIRYTVHGVLHLLGYDDLKPLRRQKMKREENRLVWKLARKFSFAELSHPVKVGT